MNRRFIFIGDSYANRKGDWDNTLTDLWNLDTWDLKGEWDSINNKWLIRQGYDKDKTKAFLIRQGGYGFIGVTTTQSPQVGGAWLDLVNSLWPDDVDKSTITDIVIVGGYNDRRNTTEKMIDKRPQTIRTETTIYNAMLKFKDWTDQFENAHVYVCCAAMHTTNRNERVNCKTSFIAYSKADSIAPNWSYLAGLEGILHNNDYVVTTNDDNHHPNPVGGYQMGLQLNRLLQNVSTNGPVIQGVLNSESDVVISPTYKYTSHINKLFAFINFLDAPLVTLNSVKKFNTWFNIGKLNGGSFIVNVPDGVAAPIILEVTDSNNNTLICAGFINFLADGTLKVRINRTNNLQNIKSFRILTSSLSQYIYD